MRVFFYICIFAGLLPVTGYSQGINTDAEVYSDSDSIGELYTEQETEMYTQEAEIIMEDREEYYVDIISSDFLDDNVMDLESREVTLNGEMSTSGEKTSADYAIEYRAALKAKTDLINKHRRNMDKVGDSLQLREEQFKELFALNEKAHKLDDLSVKAYERERAEIERLEELQWQEDLANHTARYGAPLSLVTKYQRAYDRVKNDIKNLRKNQLEEKKREIKTFDSEAEHILQRGRMDDELKRARANLDRAKLAESRKNN